MLELTPFQRDRIERQLRFSEGKWRGYISRRELFKAYAALDIPPMPEYFPQEIATFGSTYIVRHAIDWEMLQDCQKWNRKDGKWETMGIPGTKPFSRALLKELDKLPGSSPVTCPIDSDFLMLLIEHINARWILIVSPHAVARLAQGKPLD